MTDTATNESTEAVFEELDGWLDDNWDPELTVRQWWERMGLAG